MKVLNLSNRTIYVDDIEQIYIDNYYNIQTKYGTYQVKREDYFKVKDYLLSLNDEVEIIEGDKKIEKLIIEKDYNGNGDMLINQMATTDYQMLQVANKINEIIDKINNDR